MCEKLKFILMAGNLRFCRQTNEALQITKSNLAVYTKLGLNILLFRVQIMIHFQVCQVTEMKQFHVKEPLYIFFYNMKEMAEFSKSVNL